MFKVTDTTKKILFLMAGFVLAALCAGLVFYPNPMGYAKGLALAAAFSAVKMIMLERSVNKSLGMPSINARNYMQLVYLLRYLATGTVLVMAALIDSLDLLGAVVGVLSLQLAVHLVHFVMKRKESPEV